METDIKKNKEYLEKALRTKKLAVAPNAWRPLERIDFPKLVSIHDHEEHFLRKVFVESLIRANRMRVATGRGNKDLSARDVATALLMLGTAVESADVRTIDTAGKTAVKDVCPFC